MKAINPSIVNALPSASKVSAEAEKTGYVILSGAKYLLVVVSQKRFDSSRSLPWDASLRSA